MSVVAHAWQRLAGWWQAREATPAGEFPWVARRVQDNSERVEALEAQVAAQDAQLAAYEAKFADVFATMAEVTLALGGSLPDLEATMPIPAMRGLRLVTGDRVAG